MLLLLPFLHLAEACSCASFGIEDVVGCARSARAFGGTIEGYDWPLAFEMAGRRPVGVRLDVDTVWKGDVPAHVTAFTGFGGGDCGLSPAPGQRFVVCDGGAGGEEPEFSFCSHPAFGARAETLTAELGQGGPPSLVVPRLPSLVDVGTMLSLGMREGLLLAPLFASALAAALARLAHRVAPRPAATPHPRRFAAGLLGVFGLVVAGRIALRSAPVGMWSALDVQVWVGIGLAVGVGVVVSWRAQRRPSRHGGAVRGLVVSVVTIGTVLTAAFTPLHLPIQRSDVLQCSDERARAFLATLPREPDISSDYSDAATRERAWEAWRVERAEWAQTIEALARPRGCADAGLFRMRLELDASMGPCIGYADGVGGMYWRCVEFPDEVHHGWEGPG